MKIRIVKDGSVPEHLDGHWAVEETVWDAILDARESHPGSSIAVYAQSERTTTLEILFTGASNTYAEPPEHFPNKKHLLLQGILDTETREVK